MQSPLGVEAVEDNSIDSNSDDFDGDLNEGADKRPAL